MTDLIITQNITVMANLGKSIHLYRGTDDFLLQYSDDMRSEITTRYE